MELLRSFYHRVIDEFCSSDLISIKTDQFFYDPRFTPGWLLHEIMRDSYSEDDEMIGINGGHCYQHLFDDVGITKENLDKLLYICESDEIGEDYLSGDYSYYSGFLNKEIPFLLNQSTHGIEFPCWLTIFGPEYSVEIRTDEREIEVFQTVGNARKSFLETNKKLRSYYIKEFLRNTDRRLVID